MVRKIVRECVICGKKIKINVDDKRHYDNGHYFGKIKLPIDGTGEWKKVGTTKFFDKEYDVVDWTGEEEEYEHWECSKCFEEAQLEDENS